MCIRDRTKHILAYAPLANWLRVQAAVEQISMPKLLDRLLADRLPQEIRVDLTGNTALVCEKPVRNPKKTRK